MIRKQRKPSAPTPDTPDSTGGTLGPFRDDLPAGQPWDTYRSIPIRHWERLTGRGRQHIETQAATYRLPYAKTINLAEWLRAHHTLLRRISRVWSAARRADEQPGDGLLDGPTTAGLERYRQAKANLAELDLAQRRGELVKASAVRAIFASWGEAVRSGCEAIERRYGPGSADALRAAVSRARGQVGELLVDDVEPVENE